MLTVTRHRTLGAALVCLVALSALSFPAFAKKSKTAEDVFKGQIILSTKRFPSKFKTDADFVKHMKGADTKVLYADDDGEWSFEYMIFSPSAVKTLQASVTYYDITDGGRKTVNTFTLYPHDKGDRVINGRAKLNEDSNFEGHRKYLMVFSRGYGQPVLAKTEFILYPKKGSQPKEGSNTVEF